ncbi:MAG: nuclear transport factor 2 family protein [Synechococcales cyanobacterium C42_A2020_086]|jgi:ketosteroid isomerase-like protein|nr:nuclear transport factor 2 family protein [Synechococcales cyanobacterium M58_A2018_015]MBF2075174.1 nuclear transport factor 2 family protein [Synechococcales cyanobacterium C42_A2020_086]
MTILRRQVVVGGAGFAGLLATVLAKSAQAGPPEAAIAQGNAPNSVAPVHPTIATIQRFFDAYNRGEMEIVREIAAPDIVWRIPGHHPLAGPKQGVDEVVAFLQALGRSQFRSEVLYIGDNDDYVVDVHRGYSNLEGQDNIDQLWALMFRFENGRIKEVVNFPSDQHAADAFFWQVYQLKPIPERLA